MNWMKYRLIYLLISASIIGTGTFGLLKWGISFGIDFTGGIVAQYKIPSGEIKTFNYASSEKQEAETQRLEFKNQKIEEIRFEEVDPIVGPELIKKTIYALAIAAFVILLWIAYQFKSFKFGISATLATLHDSLVLIGSFALLGHFFGAEIDFLFVTAALTILSFSVHDTIVVYDRIRESQKKLGGTIYDLANKATSQTMVRSLNNSFTIIFMLVALVLLGGETTKWFAVALLIGTISGTYSSPFVAVPLLVTWDEIEKRIKSRV